MSALSLILLNALREDWKKYISFLITIVLAVLLVAGAYAAKVAFLNLAYDPLVRWEGGQITVLRSTKRPEFIQTTQGIVARWSFMLFQQEDMPPVLGGHVVNKRLRIGSWGEWRGQKLNIGLSGMEMAQKRVLPRVEQGTLPSLSEGAKTSVGHIPVAVNNPTIDIRVGDVLRLFIPKIVESGGAMNFAGWGEVVEGIDYLDFERGQYAMVQVAALVSEPFGGRNVLIMPLADLQRLAETSYINALTVYLPLVTEANITSLTEGIEDSKAGFYAVSASEVVSGMSADIRDLERHADRLMFVVFVIATIMIASVLSLILVQRKQLYVQLMVLGFRRRDLLGTTLFEVLVITALGLLLGVAIPCLIAALTGGMAGVAGLRLERFLVVIPVVLFAAGAMSYILIPKHAQCQEVLKNE